MAASTTDNRTVLQELQARGWRYRTSSNPKSRYRGTCPFGEHEHDATNPGFSITADGETFNCVKGHGGGRGLQSFNKLLGVGEVHIARPQRRRAQKRQKWQGATLQQFVEAKGEFLSGSAGLRDTTYPGTRLPVVEMPYFNVAGQRVPEATRYRVGINKGTRVASLKNGILLPYGLQHLPNARHAGYIVLVEGETDTIALHAHGFYALGIPGVSAWQPEWTVHLNGLKKVYIWEESGGEPDKNGRTPGQQMVERISSWVGEVWVIKAPPQAKDPCELAQLYGDKFPERMRELIAGAVAYTAEQPAFDPGDEQPQNSPAPGNPAEFDDCLTDGASDRNVRIQVKGKNHLYPKSHKPQQRGEIRWQQALGHFPILRNIKPIGKSEVGFNVRNQTLHLWDSYSNTWRNPGNANHKRRQAYVNLVPILNSAGPWYVRDIPVDDLGDEGAIKKQHHALLVAVGRKRENGQCFSIDNLLAKGVLSYIANAPLSGFEPVEDPVSWLVDALKAIRPPRHDEDQDRPFRPIKGTRRIQVAAEKAVDENQHRVKLLARSKQATDFNLVEAEAREKGMNTEYVSEPLFRSQCSDYNLTIHCGSLDRALQLVDGLEGYELTKFARESLREVESAV